MTMDTNGAGRPQGDPALLETEVAQRLLAATTPARLAYVAKDGTPRIMSTWFHWTGDDLVMPTFVRAPHVSRPARRLAALRANPAVAVTIDTDVEPPDVLLLRGRVTIDEVEGVAPEYATQARRRLPEQAADQLLTMIDRPGTVMARITLRPTWVGVLDFDTRLPAVMAS